MIRTLTCVAFAAALSAAPAFAQVTPTGTGTTPAAGTAPAAAAGQKLGVSDALFAMAAADGGMTEVVISEIGARKATNPQLKQFSQQMITEHTRINNELKALAARKGIALPTAITPGHQFCGQNLEGLSGDEFDTTYAVTQHVLHMDTIAMFEAEAERGQDPDMKALAAKALPHIVGHTRELKPIAMPYDKKKMEKVERMSPHAAQ